MPASPLRRSVATLNRKMLALFNRLAYREIGGQERPVVFDIERTRPELRSLDENWEGIRAELEGVLQQRTAIPRYHSIDPKQNVISAAEGSAWRTFKLFEYGAGAHLRNGLRCPRTYELVSAIPLISSAFFSILEPGRAIPAHNGPSYHYLRYHLGMVVPEKNPPSIRIRDRYITWKERESFLFDDSYNHEIFNDSDELRVVLIVDIHRPVSWPLHGLMQATQWVYRQIMTDELWAEYVAPMQVPPPDEA